MRLLIQSSWAKSLLSKLTKFRFKESVTKTWNRFSSSEIKSWSETCRFKSLLMRIKRFRHFREKMIDLDHYTLTQNTKRNKKNSSLKSSNLLKRRQLRKSLGRLLPTSNSKTTYSGNPFAKTNFKSLKTRWKKSVPKKSH